MATLSFEQSECDKLISSDVKDGFINLDKAKQRYADRIGEGNPVNGFLLTLQNLKSLMTKIDNFNLSVSADNPDDKIEYIRIWKARSREYTMLIDCNGDGTIQSPDEEFDQYHEDILILPVCHDGIDFFAKEGAELKIGDKDAILSSARPCPDWCNSSGKNISVSERYFHKIAPIRTRIISDPMPSNPYSSLCD